MAETPQGPGWWQASDGKFYPPGQLPGPAPFPPPPGGPASELPTVFGAPGAPGASGSGAPSGPGGDGVDAAGVVKSLYDFKFDNYVTPKLIRYFYAFFVIVLTLAAVGFLVASLASGGSEGVIFAIIVVPIGYFVYLILTRMYFELVAALFRIADDLRAIRRGRGL